MRVGECVRGIKRSLEDRVGRVSFTRWILDWQRWGVCWAIGWHDGGSARLSLLDPPYFLLPINVAVVARQAAGS